MRAEEGSEDSEASEPTDEAALLEDEWRECGARRGAPTGGGCGGKEARGLSLRPSVAAHEATARMLGMSWWEGIFRNLNSRAPRLACQTTRLL